MNTFLVENQTRGCVIAARIHSANDSPARRRGLLGVSDLDGDSGLWINPCEAVHTFGMQYSLDVLFLDVGLRIKKIAVQLKPNRIALCLTARSVLELKGGTAATSGTQCGDQLILHPNENPSLTL